MYVVALLSMQARAGCPAEVAAVDQSVRVAKAEKTEAARLYHETDWDYLLALGDRDKVLADQENARQRLRRAREELRSSKGAQRDLRASYTREELACDDSEPS